MSDLRDLYQEVILDHNKHPRHFGRPAAPTHRARGYNPLCGDQVEVFLVIDGEQVREASFEGDGCAICTASASLMTEAVNGQPLPEVERVFERFHHAVTDSRAELDPSLGKLAVLAGVRDYPARVKCATLPWHALQAALTHQSEVSTES